MFCIFLHAQSGTQPQELVASTKSCSASYSESWDILEHWREILSDISEQVIAPLSDMLDIDC